MEDWKTAVESQMSVSFCGNWWRGGEDGLDGGGGGGGREYACLDGGGGGKRGVWGRAGGRFGRGRWMYRCRLLLENSLARHLFASFGSNVSPAHT